MYSTSMMIGLPMLGKVLSWVAELIQAQPSTRHSAEDLWLPMSLSSEQTAHDLTFWASAKCLGHFPSSFNGYNLFAEDNYLNRALWSFGRASE